MAKKTTMTEKIVIMVTMTCPEGAEIEDVEAYVDDAVRCHKGSLTSEDPVDPMFYLDPDSVDTRFYRRRYVK